MVAGYDCRKYQKVKANERRQARRGHSPYLANPKNL